MQLNTQINNIGCKDTYIILSVYQMQKNSDDIKNAINSRE
jgi:hypothetical protein